MNGTLLSISLAVLVICLHGNKATVYNKQETKDSGGLNRATKKNGIDSSPQQPKCDPACTEHCLPFCKFECCKKDMLQPELEKEEAAEDEQELSQLDEIMHVINGTEHPSKKDRTPGGWNKQKLLSAASVLMKKKNIKIATLPAASPLTKKKNAKLTKHVRQGTYKQTYSTMPPVAIVMKKKDTKTAKLVTQGNPTSTSGKPKKNVRASKYVEQEKLAGVFVKPKKNIKTSPKHGHQGDLKTVRNNHKDAHKNAPNVINALEDLQEEIGEFDQHETNQENNEQEDDKIQDEDENAEGEQFSGETAEPNALWLAGDGVARADSSSRYGPARTDNYGNPIDEETGYNNDARYLQNASMSQNDNNVNVPVLQFNRTLGPAGIKIIGNNTVSDSANNDGGSGDDDEAERNAINDLFTFHSDESTSPSSDKDQEGSGDEVSSGESATESDVIAGGHLVENKIKENSSKDNKRPDVSKSFHYKTNKTDSFKDTNLPDASKIFHYKTDKNDDLKENRLLQEITNGFHYKAKDVSLLFDKSKDNPSITKYMNAEALKSALNAPIKKDSEGPPTGDNSSSPASPFMLDLNPSNGADDKESNQNSTSKLELKLPKESLRNLTESGGNTIILAVPIKIDDKNMIEAQAEAIKEKLLKISSERYQNGNTEKLKSGSTESSKTSSEKIKSSNTESSSLSSSSSTAAGSNTGANTNAIPVFTIPNATADNNPNSSSIMPNLSESTAKTTGDNNSAMPNLSPGNSAATEEHLQDISHNPISAVSSSQLVLDELKNKSADQEVEKEDKGFMEAIAALNKEKEIKNAKVKPLQKVQDSKQVEQVNKQESSSKASPSNASSQIKVADSESSKNIGILPSSPQEEGAEGEDNLDETLMKPVTPQTNTGKTGNVNYGALPESTASEDGKNKTLKKPESHSPRVAPKDRHKSSHHTNNTNKENQQQPQKGLSYPHQDPYFQAQQFKPNHVPVTFHQHLSNHQRQYSHPAASARRCKASCKKSCRRPSCDFHCCKLSKRVNTVRHKDKKKASKLLSHPNKEKKKKAQKTIVKAVDSINRKIAALPFHMNLPPVPKIQGNINVGTQQGQQFLKNTQTQLSALIQLLQSSTKKFAHTDTPTKKSLECNEECKIECLPTCTFECCKHDDEKYTQIVDS